MFDTLVGLIVISVLFFGPFLFTYALADASKNGKFKRS